MNDKPERKYNPSLIIGLAIPVFMVAFIGISINAPRWFNTVEPPTTDFLYLTGREDPYAQFSIVDGRLTRLESVRQHQQRASR